MKQCGKIFISFLLVFFVSQAVLAAQMRDPTKPPPEDYALYASNGGFKVRAIYAGPEHYVAVINGKTVTVGDEIYGAKIVAITPCEVDLKNENKEFSVSLCYDVKKEVKE